MAMAGVAVGGTGAGDKGAVVAAGICAGAMEAVEGGGGDGECTSVRGLLGPAAAVAEPQGAGVRADHQGATMMDN